MIARLARCTGKVQGVGFRYRTHTLAAGFSVVGYVKNLPDGSVELLAEGEKSEVERFLVAIEDRMAENIVSIQFEDVPTTNCPTFEIRY